MYANGEIKYYKDFTDYKGSIIIGASSKVRKTAKSTIAVNCERKGKEYILMQPDNGTIKYSVEQYKGHVFAIDEWIN